MIKAGRDEVDERSQEETDADNFRTSEIISRGHIIRLKHIGAADGSLYCI